MCNMCVHIFWCLLLLSWQLWTCITLAAPLESLHENEMDTMDAEEAAGHTEGDMILNQIQWAALNGDGINARNGLIADTNRWPNRVVFYKIVGNFDLNHLAAISYAIKTLETHTCIRFREADLIHKHYVAISSKPGGCYTAVGYQAKVQEMNLETFAIGEGCFRPGSILHEFMHVLGFYHEQSAADRDDFIQVLYENVQPGKEFNFEKYSSTFVTNFGIGYDYESCLHYRPSAFSINGKDTIRPLVRKAQIGQRKGLSKKDIDKINVMYKCPIQI